MKRRLLALTLAVACLSPMVALADQPVTPEPEGSFWDRLFELPIFDYLAALVADQESAPLDPEEPPTEAGPGWTPWGYSEAPFEPEEPPTEAGPTWDPWG